MPSYITHALMADKLYKVGIKNLKIFKTPIDLNKLRSFSLGVDLSTFRVSNYISHNTNTQAFFLYMITYIKENNLQEDEKIMSLLYGHIAHYFLDVNIHPLVNAIDDNTKNSTMISNHTLIESFYDLYLLDKNNVKTSSYNLYNKGITNDTGISKMVDYTYEKCYKRKKVFFSYKKIVSLFTIIDKITKGLLSRDRLYSTSGFNKFLSSNELTKNDLLNNNGREWNNKKTEKKVNKSFDELFDKSISDTLTAIEHVNKYLYGNESLSILTSVFEDLSYDTGEACKNENPIYVKTKDSSKKLSRRQIIL